MDIWALNGTKVRHGGHANLRAQRMSFLRQGLGGLQPSTCVLLRHKPNWAMNIVEGVEYESLGRIVSFRKAFASEVPAIWSASLKVASILADEIT
jgi:hypothetical protein